MTGLRPSRARSGRSRAHDIPAVVVATILVLLVTACASTTSNPGTAASAGTSSGSATAIAYSHCMRSHGVTNFPDPDGSGHLPKTGAQQLGVSRSLFEEAQRACASSLPTAGTTNAQIDQCMSTGDCPPALIQTILSEQRRYAKCIRSHGYPGFPDPTIDSEGQPYFDASGAGISHETTHSPKFMAADGTCERRVGIDGNVPVDLG